jgi:hypothetical protein
MRGIFTGTAAQALMSLVRAELYWARSGATREEVNRTSYERTTRTAGESFTRRPPIAGCAVLRPLPAHG